MIQKILKFIKLSELPKSNLEETNLLGEKEKKFTFVNIKKLVDGLNPLRLSLKGNGTISYKFYEHTSAQITFNELVFLNGNILTPDHDYIIAIASKPPNPTTYSIILNSAFILTENDRIEILAFPNIPNLKS